MRLRRLATGAGLVLVMSAGPLALAADYPPSSEAAGEVTPSRIKAGECASFSGRGFVPLTTVTVTDNGDVAGTAQADLDGGFAKQLCYGTDAKRGKHVLKGTGDAPSESVPPATVRRTVTATLIVTGVSQRDEGKAQAAGRSDAVLLPRSDVDLAGAEQSTGPVSGLPAVLAAAAGTALVAVGGSALVVTERRQRRQRRRRRQRLV